MTKQESTKLFEAFAKMLWPLFKQVEPAFEEFQAPEPAPEAKAVDLAFISDEVKTLGDGKVEGYLIRFGSPQDTDLEDDFFTADTEFHLHAGNTKSIHYHHGLNVKIGKKSIGIGSLRKDDVGIWIQSQLDLEDDYQKAIYRLAQQGRLRWSSGAVSHLVERKSVGSANQILSWPIGEASLTPAPAEYRNQAVAVKSLTASTLDLNEVTEMEDQTKNTDAVEDADIDATEEETIVDEIVIGDEIINDIKSAVLAEIQADLDEVKALREENEALREEIDAIKAYNAEASPVKRKSYRKAAKATDDATEDEVKTVKPTGRVKLNHLKLVRSA